MRIVLIALAVLPLCGCARQGNNASVPNARNSMPTVAWSKVPTYFKCDFESHAIGVAPNGQSTIVPMMPQSERNYAGR